MKAISLFSGTGGLDLGIIQAGNTILWANLGNHIVCGDISQISSNDIPDCDIVIGGFPCQVFSVANMKRHENDERNTLYKQLIRVIKDKKPKFFVAENVKGIINLAKGKVFEKILKH